MSDSESPVTFDQAQQAENEAEDLEGHTQDLLASQQVDPDMTIRELREKFENVESFLTTLPDRINRSDEVEAPEFPSEGARDEIVNRVTVPGFESVVDLLGGIGESISDIGGINDQLDIDIGSATRDQLLRTQTRALRSIALSNESAVRLALQQSQTNVDQLSALFNILSAVEPVSNITVSGRNSIDSPGQPQVAIPESDNTDIPTRKLLVRSSIDNNEAIAFGDDEVDPDNGFLLQPGEDIVVPMDLRETELYMASDEDGATVELLGVV